MKWKDRNNTAIRASVCKRPKTDRNQKVILNTPFFLTIHIPFIIALCIVKLPFCNAPTKPPSAKTTLHAHAANTFVPLVNKTGINYAPQLPTEMEDLVKLNYSAVNCNSLNLSCPTKNSWKKKIFAIVQLRSDIILLSDIRLSKKKKSTSIKN